MQISFDTHPDRYKHWTLKVDGERADLMMDVQPRGGLRDDYELKLNSYDLGVDIELADAIQRLRFEHPDVKVLVVTSGQQRVFCAGANIPMLGSSTHAFKVNFCKYTNETRLYLEDASAKSGIKTIAALNGTLAGGAFGMALACDLRIAVPEAKFFYPVMKLGYLPQPSDPARLAALVGPARAKLVLMGGARLSAEEALRFGLVDRLVPSDGLHEAVRDLAVDTLAASPEVARGIKALCRA